MPKAWIAPFGSGLDLGIDLTMEGTHPERVGLFKKRWFRFSLRSLFVTFTILAIWLGWNVHLVQQRALTEKFLVSHKAQVIYGVPKRPWRPLPLSWRLMGVRPVETILANWNTFDDEDRTNIKAAFPEAEISWANYDRKPIPK
jgi:hypothetical protein